LRLALAVVGLLALPLPVSASAQDLQTLADTVSRLERQLQTLERSLYRQGAPAAVAAGQPPAGAGPSSAAAAQLNVRIGAVGEQLRQITGDVEKLGFEVRQISERLDRMANDVDYRLRSLENGTATGSAPVPGSTRSTAGESRPPTAPATGAAGPGTLGVLTEEQLRAAGAKATTPTTAPVGTDASRATQTASAGDAVKLPAGDASSQYEYAFAYLMRRDFDGAEQAFRQFVAAHPKDELAGNAQYWLGETYYVREDFEAAARTFAEGFQRYPDSGKAADNLLKLGLSLAALDRKQDACITFAKLEASYPGSPPNILQRANRERDRLGCG
jgi:tol-pal system protein YbgF